MKVYQEAKINPMSGCLPLLIQFPILIGLYNVLRQPVAHHVFQSAAHKNCGYRIFMDDIFIITR
ncbi:YidC/Oxa1 family membrane protein insertase [Paraclostridium bifermentans]|nr:YidC/Oxa1 family membrane protein insertase [Paraclostridium bifermentans]